ncbi:MAG: HAD family hydrolase [Smithellaceae bacterium]
MSALSVNRIIVDTVIFDFDGTLAKLNIDFVKMRDEINKLVSHYGIDHEKLEHRFVLEFINEAGAIICKSSDQKGESFTADAFRIIEDIEIAAARDGALFEGTKELLTGLKEKSVRTAIITRNCAKAVHTVFPDVLSYCPVLMCRDDVKHVKPHPEQINRVLERLGAYSGRSLMIGDHPLDIETGQNAGTLTAGVLTGRFHKEDFTNSGADIILECASDILKMME